MKKFLLLACLIPSVVVAKEGAIYEDNQKQDIYEKYLLTCVQYYKNRMPYDKTIERCDCAVKGMIEHHYALMQQVVLKSDYEAMQESLTYLSLSVYACGKK